MLVLWLAFLFFYKYILLFIVTWLPVELERLVSIVRDYVKLRVKLYSLTHKSTGFYNSVILLLRMAFKSESLMFTTQQVMPLLLISISV